MRPMKLELEGFTSFRERTEIDFRGFDLFAITGQTGAGKTSLLDAMTYALYGKTSRLNKAGKDLISQGADAMSVSLRFRAGRDEYRVSRAMHGPPLRRASKYWSKGSGTRSPAASGRSVGEWSASSGWILTPSRSRSFFHRESSISSCGGAGRSSARP